MQFIGTFVLFLAVKELLKLVKVWWSWRRLQSREFFEPQCRTSATGRYGVCVCVCVQNASLATRGAKTAPWPVRNGKKLKLSLGTQSSACLLAARTCLRHSVAMTTHTSFHSSLRGGRVRCVALAMLCRWMDSVATGRAARCYWTQCPASAAVIMSCM